METHGTKQKPLGGKRFFFIIYYNMTTVWNDFETTHLPPTACSLGRTVLKYIIWYGFLLIFEGSMCDDL